MDAILDMADHAKEVINISLKPFCYQIMIHLYARCMGETIEHMKHHPIPDTNNRGYHLYVEVYIK